MKKQEALVHLTACIINSNYLGDVNIDTVIDHAEEIYNEIISRCLTDEQKQSIIKQPVYDPRYEVVEDMPVAYHQPGAPVIDCKTAPTPEPLLPILTRPDMSTIQRTFEDFLFVRGVVNRAVKHSIITREYAIMLCQFFENESMLDLRWPILKKLTKGDLYHEPNLDQAESKEFIIWLGLKELPF